ncbi:hypothetical protein Celaphus_00002350 [Cervus elaphus hippelaphus]|uniref:GB1/RHD3-type G domain-containing protein n=1 Tax=Cervus elaphus hippelaphus TaxID=46360 RepID=A0A212CF95_CEREH|nr:hypothetical protein Celaphus_00002350 [Cervus elaphus hippelaphus]
MYSLGDSKNDLRIFALAVLLSSSFVYNRMTPSTNKPWNSCNPSYVTELTELIRTKSSPSSDEVEDSAKFVSFFPDLIWTVQDFMLELELDGNPISEYEYPENVLKLIPGLGTLVEAYVDAINSGGAPCLENAVITLAECENSSVMQKAADRYSEQMTPRLSLPTDTLQELLEVHAACEREAIAVFLRDSFKDDKQMFQKKLAVMCPRIYPS